MKQKVFALITALCMAATTLPAVFADGVESGELTIGTSAQEQCSCVALCTEGNINPDCPVCSLDPSACEGTPLRPMLFGAPRAGDVLYLDENGVQQTATNAIQITEEYLALLGGWYVVDGTVGINKRVSVSYDVNLILADGCTLTINGGIEVKEGASLTIYAQSTGSSMGTLIAQVDIMNYDAGIGVSSGSSGKSGTLTINGGVVTATGGTGSAGIGGGDGGAGGEITINGGIVTATGGSNAAGIGGGYGGGGGEITITGGKVDATGGSYGAGIGRGQNGSGGTITIEGGEVTATGGSYGAGIGGGWFSGGGTITIEGGTVIATGGWSGAGIGGGVLGSGSTFSTGTDGNAVIFATGSNAQHIEDQSSKNSWRGIIFEGTEGKVYGTNVTPTEDFTIPADKTLTIEEDKTLTIQTDLTMTNEGTVTTEEGGTLINHGRIENSGTLPETIIGNQPPKITTANLSDGEVGTAYSHSFAATGESTWGLASGSTLPAGLTLNSDGTITGTPTAEGLFTFTVKAENNAGSNSKEYTLHIAAKPDTTPPTLTAGTVNRTSDKDATVTFHSDEAGTYYYEVVESGTAEPTINTTGTGTSCDTTEQTISLTNLSGTSAKDIYIVAKDTAGNQSTTLKMEIPAYVEPTTPSQPTTPADTDHTVQSGSGQQADEENTGLPSLWERAIQRIRSTPVGGRLKIYIGSYTAIPDKVLDALRSRAVTATFYDADGVEVTLPAGQVPPANVYASWTLRQLGNYLTQEQEQEQQEQTQTAQQQAPTETTTPASDTGKPNPETGSGTTVLPAIGVSALSVICLAALCKKR